MYKKPNNPMHLLGLQEILDKKTAKERPNGFKPRERDFIDIYLSFDDEVNEWVKELPEEYNFKTWKQKEYDREKEVIEFVDTLFFILQYVNSSDIYVINRFEENWNNYRDKKKKKKSLKEEICIYKSNFKSGYFGSILNSFWKVSELREITEQEIYDTYWKKWNKNMGRTEEDWTL